MGWFNSNWFGSKWFEANWFSGQPADVGGGIVPAHAPGGLTKPKRFEFPPLKPARPVTVELKPRIDPVILANIKRDQELRAKRKPAPKLITLRPIRARSGDALVILEGFRVTLPAITLRAIHAGIRKADMGVDWAAMEKRLYEMRIAADDEEVFLLMAMMQQGDK